MYIGIKIVIDCVMPKFIIQRVITIAKLFAQ